MDMNNIRFDLVRDKGCLYVYLPVEVLFEPCRFSSMQIRDIGSGNFGVAKLMRDKKTGELVAVKFIERGEKVSGTCTARSQGLNVISKYIQLICKFPITEAGYLTDRSPLPYKCR